MARDDTPPRMKRFLANPPRRIREDIVKARKLRGARPPMSRFLVKLVREQNGGCHYCHVPITVKQPRGRQRQATVDHFIPLSRGGTSAKGNLVAACWDCNQRKANKMPDEFWREINSDSRLKREAPRREARLGPQGESCGAVRQSPEISPSQPNKKG